MHPSRISYEELLEIFWMSHDPGMRPWANQYRAIIFYHDEAQKRLALESREREAANRREGIYSEVLPFTGFTLAEEYHQKYHLQQQPDLLAAFDVIYPSMKDFVNSSAVARVNGFLGGYRSRELLERKSTVMAFQIERKKVA
jgi:peptide-methionine (S)-S-oxide reductase